MDPDARKQKAHDLAADVLKQIITLATGTVALTVSFAKDVAPTKSAPYLGLLGLGWILYLGAIVVAVFALMCMAGNLEKREHASIYEGNTKFFAIGAVMFFVCGTGCLVGFAWLSLH